jgi:hypothetical protein
MELDQAIIEVLTVKPGLDTPTLAFEAGRHMGLSVPLVSARPHRDRVYRKAVRMKNTGKLVSRTEQRGNKHECLWSIA